MFEEIAYLIDLPVTKTGRETTVLDGGGGERESARIRTRLRSWVEAKMKFQEDDNEVLILSLKEMATHRQPGGALAGCYSDENGGFGCRSSMSVKGIAVAEKLMQLQTELLEAVRTVK